MKNIIDITNCSFQRVNNHNKSLVVTIDGIDYYVKPFNIVELVISEFCYFLDIECVRYQPAKKDDILCLISKSFRKEDCQYISGANLIDDFLSQMGSEDLENLGMNNLSENSKNNLETIWLALEQRYKDNDSKYADIRKVMVSLLKQYFLMILILDADFHTYNWEIEESKDHISLVPKFDNGSAFAKEVYGWEIPFKVKIGDTCQTTKSSLDYFLSVTAMEDNQIFLDLFFKAKPELLQKAIDIVKNKYNILDAFLEEMMNIYSEHYEELADMLKKKGLNR